MPLFSLPAAARWLLVVLATGFAAPLSAQSPDGRYYDIGAPELVELWVDPVQGNDAGDGSRAHPLRTVHEAWDRIPRGTPLTTGYRVLLAPGQYPASSLPVYMESRYGSYEHPIVLEAAEGPGTVQLVGGSLNVFDTRYLYLIGLSFVHDPDGAGGDVVHFEQSSYILLRQCVLDGGPRSVQEGLKANQSDHLYVEASDIHGAWDNAVDFVGVQHGHLLDNRIHDAEEWCMYLKGGAAYFVVEGNELYDCGTGGFSAGQGSGFQYLVSPWLHYEAYQMKVVNNVIHDTEGAGLGVEGGYNILMAYNTLYRVGQRSHLVEVVYGSRSCDGPAGTPDRERCAAYLAQGGWGTTAVDDGTNYVRIPNKNVYLYNNLLYNPPGYPLGEYNQQFTIFGPFTDNPAASNVPSPATADDNLRIRGNVVWNGPPGHPLGVEEGSGGCQATNAACNADQLRADNYINVFEPELIDPEGGNFRPVPGGNVFGAASFELPDFTWEGLPAYPAAPAPPGGLLRNAVPYDRDLAPRNGPGVPGAYGAAAPTATEASEAPGRPVLEGNYPNPFNPSTSIPYHLPASGEVFLTVTDVLGREVAVLVDGWVGAGSHEAVFHGQGLPSGVYVYRLWAAGTVSRPGRMLLVK